MGYGYMTWAVDIDALVEAAGSGNDSLRRQISGRFRRHITSTNDQLGWSNDRGAPNVFEALRDIIMGDPMDIPHRAAYGYAYKYMVEHLGQALDNSAFYPCSYDFASNAIDPALESIGAPIRLSALSYSDAPLDIPSPDDFPSYGYWSADDVASARDAFADADPDALTEPLLDIQGWCDIASEKGRGVVGFYH